MIQLGWDQRPGVKIVFGRWQDVLPILDQYDGIFFDTYGEHFEDMTEASHSDLLQIKVYCMPHREQVTDRDRIELGHCAFS